VVSAQVCLRADGDGSGQYHRRRPEEGQLRGRLRELAETRRRSGYRRLQVLLRREDWHVNHQRVYRLYVEENLGLRRKRGGKRTGARQPLLKPTGANQLWSGGLRDGCAECGTKVQDVEHRGRLHAGSGGHGGGYVDQRGAGGAGAGGIAAAARIAGTDSFR
jgi:HTH-like domain